MGTGTLGAGLGLTPLGAGCSRQHVPPGTCQVTGDRGQTGTTEGSAQRHSLLMTPLRMGYLPPWRVPVLSPDELVPRMEPPRARCPSKQFCVLACLSLPAPWPQAGASPRAPCTRQSSFASRGEIPSARKGPGVRVRPHTAPAPREEPFPRKIPSPRARGQVFGRESSHSRSGPAMGQRFPAAGNSLRENQLLPTPARAVSCHPSWGASRGDAQIHRDRSGIADPWFCSREGRGDRR